MLQRVDPRQEHVRSVQIELDHRMTKAQPGEAQRTAEALVDECLRANIDPLFVLAIIEVESKFDIEAVSPTGARGLMQLLPATFHAMTRAKRMFDPVENVRAGVRYLGRLRRAGFKRPESMLLAYNQGPAAAAAARDGEDVAEEGQAFVPAVMTKYKRYQTRHKAKHATAR